MQSECRVKKWRQCLRPTGWQCQMCTLIRCKYTEWLPDCTNTNSKDTCMYYLYCMTKQMVCRLLCQPLPGVSSPVVLSLLPSVHPHLGSVWVPGRSEQTLRLSEKTFGEATHSNPPTPPKTRLRTVHLSPFSWRTVCSLWMLCYITDKNG